jgi:hypothetical protein
MQLPSVSGDFALRGFRSLIWGQPCVARTGHHKIADSIVMPYAFTWNLRIQDNVTSNALDEAAMDVCQIREYLRMWRTHIAYKWLLGIRLLSARHDMTIKDSAEHQAAYQSMLYQEAVPHNLYLDSKSQCEV